MKKLIAALLILVCLSVLFAMPASAEEYTDPVAVMLDDTVGYVDMFYSSIEWYVICQLNWKFVDWDYSGEPPIVQVDAADYEYAASQYCVLTEERLQIIRSETDYNGDPIYNAETDTYTAFFVGGWGGGLPARVYAGYIKTGADTYDVYYEQVTYEFLSDVLPEGVTEYDIVGDEWPETVEYGGNIYRNGMDGYYRTKSYDKAGVKYGVKVENGNVLLDTRTWYGANEYPEEFDDLSDDELVDASCLTYEVTWYGEAWITDCETAARGKLIIPDTLDGYPVTRIESGAFRDCTGLTTVVIPDSVTYINSDAFNGCSNMQSVEIPDSVTYIGAFAFSNCANLQSIVIPEGITTLNSHVFNWCENLTSVTLPSSLKEIGGNAFYHCANLKNVTIPGGVTKIGVGAFGWCESLESIIIPDGVTSIEDQTFYNAGLEIVRLPENMTNIGALAFAYTNLCEVVIPEGITTISAEAFSHCYALTWVELPDSVTRIEDSAFSNCYELEEANLPQNITHIGSFAFFDCDLRELTIPAGVSTIQEGAFLGCDFTSVIIPEGITSIEGYAFGQCNNLASVTFLGDAPAIGYRAFLWTTTNIFYPANAEGWDEIVGNQYDGTLNWYATAPLAINTQPKTAKVKVGATVKFTVKATGTEISYQWQSSTDGKTWKNCSSSSATKATFSFTSKTSHNGNYYRCVITDMQGNKVYTDAVRAYVLGVTTQPKTATVKTGATIKYTVKATGASVKYQWQSSSDGKTWKNCSSSSATKATFSFTSKTSHNGNYYRCKITDSAGNVVYSDTVRAYVLGVSTQPKTQKVKAGTTIKLTVKATGNGLKYQWQSSTNGKTWKNCSSTSATKATFSFTSKTSHDGNYYRCKITDSAGNVVYTDTVRTYVLGITEQPVKKTVTKGKTAKFEVEATGTGLKYQWQYSTDGGKTWKNASSSTAKKATFSFTTKATHNGYYYRCKVTDSAGNYVYSSKVKLTVK